MALVPVAACAAHLDPAHAMALVGMLGDMGGVHRLGEARPARSRIIFVDAVEQLELARGAGIDAVGLVVGVAPGIGAFGAGFAQHVELFRGQALAPLGLGEIEMLHGHKHVCARRVRVNPGSRGSGPNPC